MNGLFLFLATFLAATIEGVEMAAILVGVGTARGWRSTIFGSLAGFALLTVLTTVLGNTLLRIPIQGLWGYCRIIAAHSGPSMAQKSSAADRTAAHEEQGIG